MNALLLLIKMIIVKNIREMFMKEFKNKVPEKLFQAVTEEKFSTFTRPELKPLIQIHMEYIVKERNPNLSSLSKEGF